MAGWLHYLAFDLFVGAWVARAAYADGVPHLAVVPLLLVTFLFGPAGYLASLAVRSAWRAGGGGRNGPRPPGSPGPDPWLMRTAVLCFAAAVPTALAAALDARTVGGANVWMKPLKFEISVAVYLATLAFFMPLASPAFRRSSAGRFVVWSAVAAGTLEIAYIAWRASRAEASHFNTTTPTAGILYGLMGVGALLLMAASPVLAWGVARSDAPRTAPVFRLAVVLGLVTAFVLGTTGGVVISTWGAHAVGGTEATDPVVPVVGWSRVAGDLRAPHFTGLHALQFVPLVGAIAATWFGRWGATSVIAATALYALATAALLVQALAGRPVLPL